MFKVQVEGCRSLRVKSILGSACVTLLGLLLGTDVLLGVIWCVDDILSHLRSPLGFRD